MMMKQFSKIFMVTLLTLCIAVPAFANPITVRTAWVVGQEGFPVWLARKKGWDKELNMQLEIRIYQAGKEALQDFNVDNWYFGGLGAVPTMLGAAGGNMSVIGLASNEAKANAIMVHPNSPLLSMKGANNEFPNAYGSADTVKGKTVITTVGTSADYTVNMWLKALGLMQKDIDLQNMSQDIALVSFKHNKGDAVALWAPFTFTALADKWQTVATAKDVGAELPIFLVANKKFTEQYPEVTKDFLALYLRGVNWLLETPREQAISELQAYYKEVFLLDYPDTIVGLQFDSFELLNLEGQQKLFKVMSGQSMAQQWQNNIAAFFIDDSGLNQSERKQVEGSNYITPKFIDMVTSSDIE